MQQNDCSIKKRLWLLFLTFFKIALFVVGGGLAMLPVIEEVFVRKNKLITCDDMLDMVVITQTVPGLIAVNSAVYIGTKIAGFLGALTALFGVMMPSIIIILIIAALFPELDSSNPVIMEAFVCVRACITGVFIVTALRLAVKALTSPLDAVLASFFLAALIGGINPVYIILLSMPIGLFCVWCGRKKLVVPREKKTHA